MTAEPNVPVDIANQDRGSASARCPHVVFRDVLGAEAVADLLRHVTLHESDFRPATVRSRTSGVPRVDYGLRQCLYFSDLGASEGPIKAFLRDIVAPALKHLSVNVPDVEPKEFEISGYRDGGHFGAHIDTDERLSRVRVVSCVYYFAATPRRFSGGELRLHGLPSRSLTEPAVPFVDVAPETDTLVAFPSWLRHEVLPVYVPSGVWADGRFTINCWFRRLREGTAAKGPAAGG
jgi:SM-20-related protein